LQPVKRKVELAVQLHYLLELVTVAWVEQSPSPQVEQAVLAVVKFCFSAAPVTEALVEVLYYRQ
jgi:hypothetical protein